MTYLLALIAGIVGATVGFVAAAALAIGYAALTGMSNFEGASGFFAVFGAGPIGGLAGLIAGIWITLRRRGGQRGAALAGRGFLVVAGIGLLIAAVVGVLYLQRDLVSSNSLPPQLLFEIRLPPGVDAPQQQSAVSIELTTDRNQMPAWLASDWARAENGRTVISGGVELYYRTSQRILVFRLRNEPARLFKLPLKASPAYTDAFSAWRPVDLIDDNTGQPRRATAADAYDIRYRIEDRSR